MTQAYPLHWPAGWPRTLPGLRQDSKARFRRTGRQQPFWTFAAARDALMRELDVIGARNCVLSTNYERRLDGLPYASSRAPDDTGVAVYFSLHGAQKVMACDMHLRAEENMRSLTLAIEAMRQLERHGGGHMMETAFRGFTALPPPDTLGARHWAAELGLTATAGESAIRAAWRDRVFAARQAGDEAMVARLNVARDNALKALANA